MGVKDILSGSIVGELTTKVSEGAKEHAPVLLLIGATISFGLTIYETVKVTPKVTSIFSKSKEEIENVKEKKNEEGKELSEEEKKDEIRKIKIDTGIKVAKVVAKPVVFGAATVGSMWVSDYLRVREIKNLTSTLMGTAALYDISKDSLKKYKAKTKEAVGKETADNLQNAVDMDTAMKYSTGNGYYARSANEPDAIWFIDPYIGRKFKATRASVENARAYVNNLIGDGCYDGISLNYFYEDLGLPEVNVGINHGWNRENSPFTIRYSSMLEVDGKPYCVIEYDIFLLHGEYQ